MNSLPPDVFEGNYGQWWFYDETADLHGPYASKKEATVQREKYLKFLENGPPGSRKEKSMKVEDYIKEIERIRADRKAKYGDNWKAIGDIMIGFFPNGLQLKTAQDFGRLHLFYHMIGKLSRYAAASPKAGDPDSLTDLSLYALLTRAFDEADGEEV